MDSPLCIDCLRDGVKQPQTYRVRGAGTKKQFKCGTCKDIIDASEFNDLDYHWKDKAEEWKALMLTRGIKIV